METAVSSQVMSDRSLAVLTLAADQAIATPLLPSGLWFHNDLRNNLYYAMHLYVAASTDEVTLVAPKPWAKQMAETILMNVLSLQQREPEEGLYGHFPLGLGDHPSEAPPHELPVELVGNLLVLFITKYKAILSPALEQEMNQTIHHIYNSKLAEVPQIHYHHHETKQFSLQIMLGTYLQDEALLDRGHEHLQSILKRIRTYGFHEYGILPWFWHWIQAVTCVWETVQKEEIKDTAHELLQWLWNYRAEHYLQGAWIGARSRGWAHDLPGDGNLLIDYIQFGNCVLPNRIARLEAAALLHYDAGEIIRSAVLREETEECIRTIARPVHDEEQEAYMEYIYRTKNYAVGGMREYIREFDNEQMRYQITLPAREDGSTNQVYFFHPGEGYQPGDLRHASGCGEVLLNTNVAAILFAIPEQQADEMIGSLPLGRWSFHPHCLIGDLGDVFLIAHLWQRYEVKATVSGLHIHSRGRNNGAVLEVVSREEAAERGIDSFQAVIQHVVHHKVEFNSQGTRLQLQYHSIMGDELLLRVDQDSRQTHRWINGLIG